MIYEVGSKKNFGSRRCEIWTKCYASPTSYLLLPTSCIPPQFFKQQSLMDKQTQHSIRLGIFVTLGLAILTATIYFIGARQSLFGGRTIVYGVFRNVGGLQEGNSVRFSGISVGTVKQIELSGDSTVRVTLLIDDEAAQYIKKDAIASIGSEGIMGDKLISISVGSPQAPAIMDGDKVLTTEPIELETMMAALTETGEKAQQLVANLAALSQSIRNGKGVAGRLMTDSTLSRRFDRMVADLEKTGQSASGLSQDFSMLSTRIRNGQGTLGKLMMDDALANNLNQLMDTLQVSGNKAARVSGELEAFSRKLNNQEGAVGKFLTDTTFAENMGQTLTQVKMTAQSLNSTTERINQSRLFKFLFGKKKQDQSVEASANRGDMVRKTEEGGK